MKFNSKKNDFLQGLVANETLGYFMARIQAYMLKIGILPERLRFRQHMNNEMAHYACDCWDAECLTSYGWIECVGCADRSAYDLTQHTRATGVKLVAEKKLDAPKTVEVTEAVANKAIIGKEFKKDAKRICDKLANLEADQQKALQDGLNANGSYELEVDAGLKVTLTKTMVEVKSTTKTMHVEEITPSVIEPSFGIGRIMYSLLEHRFNIRDGDEQRSYFALPASIAPIKCSVLPLSANAEFAPFVQKISTALTRNDVSHKVDDSSGSIGRRYVRTDEIAIPYGITIDFDSLKEPHTVTLRERDSMSQLRVPLDDIADLVRNLAFDKVNWADVSNKYPKFEQQETTK